MARTEASPEMTAFAALIREQRTSTPRPDSIAEQRTRMEEQQAQLPIPDDIERRELTVGGVPCRFVVAPEANKDKVVMYLHGGGYVLGSLNTHTELMGRISRATGGAVLGVDYRLAPEHPYPAAVDDAVAVYEHLVTELEPTQIMIAGDSAGGGLALACMLELKERKQPLPVGAILLSPWTDLTGSGKSVETRADVEPMIEPDMLGDMAALYCADHDPLNPGISPLFGDLKGLPPLLIQVGDHEVLLDDSLRLAEAAKKRWVVQKLHVFPGAFHVFQAVPTLPESEEALAEIGEFFKKRIVVPKD